MVKYVYDKHNISYSSGSYGISWEPKVHQEQSGSWNLGGAASYSLNYSNGEVTLSGSRTISDINPGTNYSAIRSGYWKIFEYTTSGTGYYSQTGTVYFSGGSAYKGSFVESVIAENGTYPTNGTSGSYWYVRKIEATPPTLTSPVGGESWNELHEVTWNNTQTGFNYLIELSLNNGGAWSTLLAETAVDASSFSYNFKDISETSLAKIRVTGLKEGSKTQYAESPGVFSIMHNKAPYAPNNLQPSGIVINRTLVNQFSWRHNDPNPNDAQSKKDVRYRRQGESVWINMDGIPGVAQSVAFNSNHFAAGVYEWQVRTYDQSGLVSPYSATAVFTSSDPTNAPIIIQPSNTVPVSRPVIEWTGGAQASYQILIEDALGAAVWDTGEIISNVKARTSGIELINGATYNIKVRIKDSGGLFSSFTEKTITISYTPPAKPILTAFTGQYGVQLIVDNPTPTGTQPVIERNDLYKLSDGEWIRIAVNIYNAYSDLSTASNKSTTYKVRTFGINETISESDVVTIQAPKLTGSLIHSVDNPEETIRNYKYNGTGYATEYTPSSAVRQFAGRRRPAIEYGNYEDNTLTALIQEREGSGDMDALLAMVRSRDTLCYRDNDGNKIYGHILTLNKTKDYRISNAEITVIEIDYFEEV